MQGLVDDAQARRPKDAVQFLSLDDEHPAWFVGLGATLTSVERTGIYMYDSRTGAFLHAPPANEGVLNFLFKLHVELFAGLPGTLFLGAMGGLFVASIVSGVVVYGPFMRRLAFGTIRHTGSGRLTWLDLHNLLGIVTVALGASRRRDGCHQHVGTAPVRLLAADGGGRHGGALGGQAASHHRQTVGRRRGHRASGGTRHGRALRPISRHSFRHSLPLHGLHARPDSLDLATPQTAIDRRGDRAVDGRTDITLVSDRSRPVPTPSLWRLRWHALKSGLGITGCHHNHRADQRIVSVVEEAAYLYRTSVD